MSDEGRTRSWHLTVNNYRDVDYEVAYKIADGCRYAVVAMEVGSENFTPHLQCFFYFFNAKTFGQVVKLMDGHWSRMYSDMDSSIAYCQKGGCYEEFGVRPVGAVEGARAGGDATRQKWDRVMCLVKSGKIGEVDPQLLVAHYANLKRMYFDFRPDPKPLDGVCGYWFHGPVGCGKSHKARELYENYYLKDATIWWDGYVKDNNERPVIMEDVDQKVEPLCWYLKLWSDRYEFRAQVKGGYVVIRPTVFIITSQFPIDSLFHDWETRAALHDRFEEVLFNKRFAEKRPRQSDDDRMSALKAELTVMP